MVMKKFLWAGIASFVVILPVVLGEGSPTSVQPAADPLPSWKDTPTKKAILDYVNAVTKKDGPDYVPPADRIATFDNDGTMWCEKPTVEVVFSETRLKALAAKDPTLKEKQPFKAALDRDEDYLHKAGMKALLEIVLLTHGNMPQADFDKEASEFFKTARHPKFGVPYPEIAYVRWSSCCNISVPTVFKPGSAPAAPWISCALHAGKLTASRLSR